MNVYPYFEILNYENQDHRLKWKNISHIFPEFDIYFLPEYSYLFELNGDGKAHCFVYYQSEKEVVIYPFLKRQINKMKDFSDISEDLFDITSPYGYGGYLRNNENIDIEKFYAVFSDYCRQNNIISEFVRFHPLLKNHAYCPKQVNLVNWNETVFIDLTVDGEELFYNFNQKRRNRIRKAQKMGIKIIEDIDMNHLQTFYDIYTQTMQYVAAKEYFTFSKEWFEKMIDLFKPKIALFHAILESKVIASGIFIWHENIIQYKFSGISVETRHLPANCLLIYEVALWAKERGIKYFHLGGGLTQNDDLFKFKSHFSHDRGQYFLGTVIHNPEIYRYLEMQITEKKPVQSLNTNFFPAYRAPREIARS